MENLRSRLMDLEIENQKLKRQLEALRGTTETEIALATAASGKVKNARHLLTIARSEKAIAPGGLKYKGEQNLSPAQYLQRLQSDSNYQHLFSSGDGSKTSIPASENPWREGSINLTKQCELMRQNPSLAAELKAAARG